MVVHTPWIPVLLLLGTVVAASGCTDTNAVTLTYQGASTGSHSKTLRCDGDGRISFGVQGAGSLTITVKDGDGKEIFRDANFGAGQDGQSTSIEGKKGTWTLKVSRNFGFSGQYGITLTC